MKKGRKGDRLEKGEGEMRVRETVEEVLINGAAQAISQKK